jgi:hypothetical protein
MFMKKLFFYLSTLAFGLYATESSAQIFRLKVTDYGSGAGVSVFENFVNTEIAKIEADINKDLPSAPPQRLMEGMANSSVMAGKGIGTDYASNMSVFLVGANVGVGADLEKDKNTDSDLSGIGVAPGIVIGANLKFLDTAKILGMDTNRLNMFVNFMNYSHKQNISDDPGKESDAKLDMMAMGVHFRYDWIKGRGSKWLGWGGVKFNFGYEYNKTDITFNSNIKESVSETDSNGNVISGTITGNPYATINSATHSIPLALSTDVQILYFLSLYTGLGADYNFGEATGKGSLNAPESTINCSNASAGQVCSGVGTSVKVQPEANIDATGKVNPFIFRGFAGVQFNLPFIRIFGQVDKALGNDLIGATAGVRFVY